MKARRTIHRLNDYSGVGPASDVASSGIVWMVGRVSSDADPNQLSIFGYPGLAIVCFFAAAAGGFRLVISIPVQDHKGRKKPTQ